MNSEPYNVRYLAFTAVLLLSSLAFASEATTYRAELRLDATFQNSSAEARSAFTLSSALNPKLTATYYAQPLVDDPQRAIGLLTFFQHPDNASLSVATSLGLSDGSESAPSETLTATLYPWRSTGFFGSLSVSPTSPSVNSTFQVGLTQYWLPGLRMEASYVGYRNELGHTRTTRPELSVPDEAEYVRYGSDRGHLSLTGVLLDEHLELNGTGEVGPTSTTSGDGSAANGLKLSAGNGSSYLGSASATVFLGRRWSLQGTVGLRGSNAGSDQGTHHTSNASRTEYGDFNVTCYVEEAYFIRAEFEDDFTRSITPVFPDTVIRLRLLTFSLGGRF